MKKLPVLNGLRGIAILAVIFHHSFFPYILYGMKDGRPVVPLNPLIVLESSGWLGVNLFFFLSGFVLYLPYAEQRRSFNGMVSVKDFYAHRARRLLPLYYITTLAFLILNASYQLTDVDLYKNIASYVIATFIFSKETFFPAANWVLWSLGVEIWFSIAFPLIAVLLRRYGWSKVLPFVLVLSLIVRIGGRMLLPDGPRPNINYLSDSLFGRLDEFLWGMLAAQLFVSRRAIVHPWLQLLLGLLFVAASSTAWAMWYRGHFSFPVAGLFNIPLDLGLLLIVGGLVAGCAPVTRLISIWPLQLSGLMCYSLYLWHGAIITKYRPSAYSMPTYLAYLAITYIVSWLSYRYIEFGAVKEWRELLPSRYMRLAVPASQSV